MRKNILIIVLSISLCACFVCIAANNMPKLNNLICFDASKVVNHYVGQGQNSYSFKIVNDVDNNSVLNITFGKNAGLIVCKGDFDFTNHLNKVFPKAGC